MVFIGERLLESYFSKETEDVLVSCSYLQGAHSPDKHVCVLFLHYIGVTNLYLSYLGIGRSLWLLYVEGIEVSPVASMVYISPYQVLSLKTDVALWVCCCHLLHSIVSRKKADTFLFHHISLFPRSSCTWSPRRRH